MKNYDDLINDNPELLVLLSELLKTYTVQELVGLIKSVEAKQALSLLKEQPFSYIGNEKSG